MTRGRRINKPENGLSQEDRDQLARDHRPLVLNWCRKLAPKAPPHMDADDIEAFGWRGLAHALEKFDPTRGVSFGAFAGPWVRGAILRGFRREIPSLQWRGQVIDRKVDGRRSRWETLVEPEKPQGPTILVAAIVVDGIKPSVLENRVMAIEALAPTRLAILTGEEAVELLNLPDTRRLAGTGGQE